MQRLDRILAVIDPNVDVQHGALKAARLARAAGATLELFACDFDPALTGQPFFDTDALRHMREQFVQARAVRLEELAAELRAGELEVVTHVHWDNLLHIGILRRVEEFAPDLVVKDTHHHAVPRRTLFSNTDWTLIRQCPVPLLLAKSGAWPGRPSILAALDPLPRHADTAAVLDADILDAALHLTKTLAGTLEIVHAFFPAALLAAAGDIGGLPLASDELIAAERGRATEAIHALAATHGVPRDAVKVLQGAAGELLPRYAAQSHADVVVMGAVARGRVRDFFIGSTAERVLDRLPSDVLVVKCADFGEGLPF
jgi:universal stress protein E